jgi:hypothetical protein
MLDIESHKEFAPTVGRVLRIEWLAETVINDVSLFLLFLNFLIRMIFGNPMVDCLGSFFVVDKHTINYDRA